MPHRRIFLLPVSGKNLRGTLQGCQIFLGTTYPESGILTTYYTKLLPIKYTKWPNLFPTDIKYTKNYPFQGPFKIYPNWNYWYENKPSGNPGTVSLIPVEERN
jgi:hypothetical protein